MGHGAAVVQIVRDLAFASDGGMFVLFTSHASLRRAAAELRMALGTRWPLLVQGEAPRDVLLRRFREAENAILLGTDSFWEGVDVPGRALRALVLNKLPFKVPTEPLTAARLERLAEQGQDGFIHYLLPHAALKLKQGFGRLDPEPEGCRGRACLLDSRVGHQAVRAARCSADCRGRSGWSGPGPRSGPSARISSRGTESEPSYDRAAPRRRSSASAATTWPTRRSWATRCPPSPSSSSSRRPPSSVMVTLSGCRASPSRVEFEAEIGVVIGPRVQESQPCRGGSVRSPGTPASTTSPAATSRRKTASGAGPRGSTRSVRPDPAWPRGWTGATWRSSAGSMGRSVSAPVQPTCTFRFRTWCRSSAA